MVPRRKISAIDINTPLAEVIAFVAQSPFSRLPVYRDSIDNIVGMLHTKDLVRWRVSGARDEALASLLRPIASVHESVTVDKVLRELRERRSHLALVVDEFGGTAGLLTLEDVLSELLGDVGDEFKAGDPVAETLPDGHFRLPGSMAVDDAATLLNTEWETEATTDWRARDGGARPSAGARAIASIVGEYEFEVERVADRAAEFVLARPVVHRSRRTRTSDGPRFRARHHPAARHRQRAVRGRGVRHRRRAAREHRAPGRRRATAWPRGSCASSKIRSGRTGISRRRRSAFRWRASALACTASTSWPIGSRCGCEPLEAAFRWIAAHAVASVVAVSLLTYLHIVIGEMVPKALALQRAARTVLYVSPLILAIQTALLPVVVGLNAIGTGLLRLIGVRRQEVETERYHTTEELQYIIEESQEGGMLRGESGRILRELFEFGDLTAGEVMVPRVMLTGIEAGTGPDELSRIVRANPHTRYPIFAGDLDNIIGSLHIKEALRHLVAEKPVTARDARPLPYVPGPAPLDEVLAVMRRYRAQMAVVMDQHGGTAGLVTMEDLFEEVVGDIEEGHGRRSIVREAPGRFRMRGTVRLEEAGEVLGCAMDHPKVTTISGLVL